MTGRVLVTTVPFGDPDRRPVEMLNAAGIPFDVQAFERRVTEAELVAMIAPYEVLIAGTEMISARVLDAAPMLRLIARVGIGLDGVDLLATRSRGITVTYTPDAPSPAVAEFTLGLILDLSRHQTTADRNLRAGTWKRSMGRRLDGATIGVVGVGRIGSRVIRILRGAFPGARILANDLSPDDAFGRANDVMWVEKDELYATSDIVTVHVPLTTRTRHMIGARELGLMRPGSALVNAARGGVVEETALADALRSGALSGAAVDVFEREPYSGELATLPNCLVTCHMGSMTADCRARMEVEATAEALRMLRGEPVAIPVPEAEYELRGGSA